MLAPGYHLILLFSPTGGPALPGVPFRLGIPYQARMETHLPEVHMTGYPRPDLLGPADAQRLRKNNASKDKGSLGVPTPAENLALFCSQYGRKSGTLMLLRVWHTSYHNVRLAGTNGAARLCCAQLPYSGATHRCDVESLCRLPATTCAHGQG